MNRSARQINALTALRFFAALLVVVFHHGQSAFASAPSWCQSLIKGGYVGVPFFFVLSGFILAYNYLPDARAGTLDNRRFWLARFARIYPVYAFALLLGAPIFMATLWQTQPTVEALARFGLQAGLSFGLIQAWTPQWAFTWNGPAWSLSVEAFFYLAFPFLTKQLDTKGRWVLLVGFVCGVGALVSIGLMCGWNVIASAQQVLGWTNPVLWLALFVLGLCAGDLHLQRCAADDGTNQRPFWTAVITIGLMAVILLVVSSSLQRRSQLLLCYAVTVPCALLIYLLAKHGNPVSRCLDWRGLVLLGEASYSLYILHRPVHEWFGWMENQWGLISPSTAGGFVFYLATCLALSVFALKWIEYPCRDWIKRRLGPRSVQPANVSSLAETCTATLMR